MLEEVAIVGAGLAGTALGLALSLREIPCQIYEAKDPDAAQIASGVVLTPNGLKVLDSLGVLDRIKSKCWKSEFRTLKDDKDQTIRKSVIANEALYGYRNHRLYRWILLAEMKKMLEERGVPIAYNAKVENIANDCEDKVIFTVNGEPSQASMLIGADGIYSTVRNYLEPNVTPEYTGTTGIIGHIFSSTVEWPYSGYEKACTIQGKPGAIFMIPEDEDGSEIMVGKQAQLDRDEGESLAKDQEKMCEFFRDRYSEWNRTARSIIDSVCSRKETMYCWPFLRMPRLKNWYSDTGRVVILGDAAHALPPSSGQGVNQALEDVYSFTLILKSETDLREALRKWQDLRQARIEEIFEWATNSTNVERMSIDERNKLIQEGKANYSRASNPDDMSWLYSPNLDKYIEVLGK